MRHPLQKCSSRGVPYFFSFLTQAIHGLMVSTSRRRSDSTIAFELMNLNFGFMSSALTFPILPLFPSSTLSKMSLILVYFLPALEIIL